MSSKKSKTKIYDVAIIGGGPAGLTSAIYSARYQLDTIVFSNSYGGTASMAHKICNFPTYTEISGLEFIDRMINQVTKLEVPIIYENVVDIKSEKNNFIIKSDSKNYKAKKIILAIGTKRRKLGLSKEGKYLGKNLSYCATCDGPLYKNKIVAVVGSGNSAVTSALMLSDIAKVVYLIYRKDKLKAEPAWLNLLKKTKNIKLISNMQIIDLVGENNLEAVILNNKNQLKINGLFVEIGSITDTELLTKLKIKFDKEGYIVVNNNQNTTIKGIYAAGDCTNFSSLKQIITASSQGAIAVDNIYKELKE
ncbi:MAG: FAD-dependent oxidoreductase [archaeon]